MVPLGVNGFKGCQKSGTTIGAGGTDLQWLQNHGPLHHAMQSPITATPKWFDMKSRYLINKEAWHMLTMDLDTLYTYVQWHDSAGKYKNKRQGGPFCMNAWKQFCLHDSYDPEVWENMLGMTQDQLLESVECN